MKKRIFLVLAIAATLICMLAISVSAQEIKKFETDEFQSGDNITYLEGINEDMYLGQDGRNNSFYELLDPSFTARAVLKNSDETYTTYPAWYFVDYYHYWNGADNSYTMERINALSDVTGETYSANSIIRYEFPEYKPNHGFALKPYASFGFQNAKYVRVPSHATSVSFRNSRSLVEIEYAPGTNITSISNMAFVDCHSLEVVRIPNTATSMGSEIVCFWSTNMSTAALKEIYLGANMASMGTKNPLNTAKINGLKIYVPATIDGSKYTFSSYFPSTSMLIFTGTKAEAEAFGASKVISYEEYASSGLAHEAGTIVYGYSACDAFYDGKHVEKTADNNPCFIADCENCNVLNLYVGNESTHSEATTIVYESYDKAGSKIVYCENEGCTHNVTEEVPSLFESRGYSVAENGAGGIAIGFKVNEEAIAEYENITGTVVNYGVFAVLADNIGDKDIFDESGAPRTGVISADMTNADYSIFRIKMAGFEKTQLDVDFAMGAYVGVSNDTATEYAYLQIADASEGEKYFFASYNDIVAMASPKE